MLYNAVSCLYDVVRAVLVGAIQDSKTVCGVLAARAAGVLE